MRKQDGFSLIELLVVVAIILIIAAIAVPNLLRARMSANEAAAVATVRNLNNSQLTYIVDFASVGYADTLAKLGPGTPCDASHGCLVDELVACASQPCTKGGYQYYVAAGTGTPVASYTFTATPVGWNSTGRENFCTVEDGIIKKELSPSDKLAGAVAHSDCSDSTKYEAIN